jgi:putative transposase
LKNCQSIQQPSGFLYRSKNGARCPKKGNCEFKGALDQFEMNASMSRKGNCYDNAPMESFWGTLKTELIYSHGKYATRREAELAIQEYIEVFYNRQRIQKAAGISFPGNV